MMANHPAQALRVMFDASALTPRYAHEPGHDRVQDLCARATELLVTAHCKAELAAALSRRHHEGVLSASDYQRVKARLVQDFADMTLVPLDERVERQALAALERQPMQGMEAIQVASARVARADLFVTADRRQARLARDMGVPTECLLDDLRGPV
jgi:predicted nucleic acid-binding protein